MYVRLYEPSDKIVWDEFCKLAKNEHFFFCREYMDYHSDRFNDNSLMFFDDKNSLVALLPANISGGDIISHQGLTFGGLIIKPSIKQKELLNVFSVMKRYLQENSLDRLIYKKVPYIYNNMPCDEDLYALFRVGAKLVRRDVSSSINIANQIKYSKGRKWIVKKSKDANLIYERTDNIDEFWNNLEEVLSDGHGAKPVHSASEIKKLKKLFPQNIKFYCAVKDNKQLAGAVIFETKNVAHTQYLYNTIEGREFGALDGLVDYLVKQEFDSKEYFDFGISNENQGLYLNEGLIAQKEGFGARAVVHDFYELEAND